MLQSVFPNGVEHYIVGGLIIGLGVGLLYITTGLVGGMSGIYSCAVSFVSRLPYFRQPRFVSSRRWRLVYAAGLVLGAILHGILSSRPEPYVTGVGWPALLAGGFLAGFGARLGHGCTSGHGICGLASLQLPSLCAVLTFLATGIVTAHAMAWLGAAR